MLASSMNPINEESAPADLQNAVVTDGYYSFIRKRLLTRYACAVPGHRYCIIAEGRHEPLEDKNIEEWTNACVS